MIEDVLERYATYNTKGFPDELISGGFNDKTIPSYYYNILNNEDYKGNNILGTPVENDLLDNKEREDPVVPNDEHIDD